VDKKAIIQRALDNINHPLSEITRRMTYRARSPGVAPVSGIKMALPKTSTMAKKMQKVLDDETPAGRKKQKQMANLVIGREEDDKEILLQFKTAASREKFRKLMNEDVQLGEEVIKARVAFFGRPNQNNSDMRDAKKKNMFVDAKDVSAAKGKMFDVTFNSRRQFNRFESEYDFLMVKVFEDVQLDETMTARDLESMIKGLKRGAKQEIADALNDMNLSGYGDYEARVDNIHKFKTKDLFNAMKKVMKLESLRLEERAMTYVIDRKTKKIVHGPTDTGDAKLYLKKQIQPRKLMIRQIRGAAKKVGDTV